jgi:hypothetical protein
MPRNRTHSRSIDNRPRDGKRTPRAKSRDQSIRKARAAKRAIQGR